MMPWIKSALAGVIGGLFLVIMFELSIFAGLLPFELIPVLRFLEIIGLPFPLLGYSLAILCGVFWSLFLVFVFHNNTGWSRGLALGVIIWLGFILVFSPLAGWGLLGFEVARTTWEVVGFLFISLLVYLLFGSVLGYLNNLWVYFDTGVEDEISNYRQ